MKILILEDEQYFQNEIVKIIKKTVKDYEYSLYSNISECLLDHAYYDLAVLDIHLKDGDGIEFARNHSHQFDSILFLTSMENRIYDAFGKNVIGFIPKDNMNTSLPLKLKEIESNITSNNRLQIKTENGIVVLDLKDIIYIQTDLRNIQIIAKQNYILKRMTISKFAKELDSRFVWISQSMLINLDYVSAWKKDEILLNDTYKVYASRRYLKEALQVFMERN